MTVETILHARPRSGRRKPVGTTPTLSAETMAACRGRAVERTEPELLEFVMALARDLVHADAVSEGHRSHGSAPSEMTSAQVIGQPRGDGK